MFGKVENPKNENLPDLSLREFVTFAPLLMLAVWIGLYPTPFLERLEPSVDARRRCASARTSTARRSPECDRLPTPARGRRGAAPPRDRAAPDSLIERRRAASDCDGAGRGRDRSSRTGAHADAGRAFVSDFYYLLPELVLTAGALLVLVADVLLPRARNALLRVGLARRARRRGRRARARAPARNVDVASGLIAVDRFALFFKVLFLVAAILTVLMSPRYLESRACAPGEYYFLILCATLGMMIMAGGIDLITIFIGLETMAISFYILAGFIKPNQRSNEAAVKYFLLGAFSLGILLYGMSLLYGLSGTTNLRDDGDVARRRPGADLRLPFAVILVVAGIGLQDRGRAVPHVGARRVRRRADADHGVPVGRLEGGVVRDAAAHLRRGPAGFRADGLGRCGACRSAGARSSTCSRS